MSLLGIAMAVGTLFLVIVTLVEKVAHDLKRIVPRKTVKSNEARPEPPPHT